MATIRKRGTKWQVQIRRVGVRAISRSFHMRKDAEAWGRQMEVQADRRELPRDPKALQRLTLGQLVERYRDTVSVRKRGYDVERIVLNAFLRHRICSKPLSEIEASDFASYRDERLMTIKPSTLKRELAPLHNMFELARDEWRLPLRENPLHKVRVTSAQQRRERRLKPGELDGLITASRACRNQLILPIVLLAVETGMRRGEILSLRWEHVDREAPALLIPHSKNGHPRVAWDRLRAPARITDLHFHDLRHEAISRFFERGLSVPEVALLSGHRDARMLFRYTHPMRELILRKLEPYR
jgi:integrase